MNKWIRRLRMLFLLAAVTTLATLVLWPVPAEGLPGDPEQARACSRTLDRLSSTVSRGKTAQGILTEAEINAHLAHILALNPQARASRGLTLGLRDLRVDLEPTAAKLFIITELAGVPVTIESRFCEVASAREPLRLEVLSLGRLPLVEPFKTLTAGFLRGLLKNLHDERTVLENLTSLAMTSNQALVAVGPRAQQG